MLLTSMALASARDERMAAVAGLEDFLRTLSGVVATSGITTSSDSQSSYLRAELVGLADLVGDVALIPASVGFRSDAFRGALDFLTQSRSVMLAISRDPWAVALFFVLAAAIIWIAPWPARRFDLSPAGHWDRLVTGAWPGGRLPGLAAGETAAMKTLGLLGGLSWESTVPYYRFINEAVRSRLGGLHSAKILLASVDFAEVEALMRADQWDEAGALLARFAAVLERAGADALLLCSNTLHKVAPAIERAVTVPLLHIVDPTAEAVKRAGVSKVGLLATGFTMEARFYVDRLRQQGLEAIIPAAEDRARAHRIIFEELCLGKVLGESRRTYQHIIDRLAARGAEGVILGCTELAMLIAAADSVLPVFDTTVLHAEHAAAWALA
jgi:aspartate racemase